LRRRKYEDVEGTLKNKIKIDPTILIATVEGEKFVTRFEFLGQFKFYCRIKHTVREGLNESVSPTFIKTLLKTIR
jgi:hypothetical protein